MLTNAYNHLYTLLTAYYHFSYCSMIKRFVSCILFTKLYYMKFEVFYIDPLYRLVIYPMPHVKGSMKDFLTLADAVVYIHETLNTYL